MKIAQVLKNKPIHEIYTVSQNDSVNDAANKLSELRIGSLLVSEDGNSIDGILSERDIVRELGKTGKTCLDSKVGSIMTADVITINSEDDTANAAQIMTSKRFRHLPVVDNGQLVGVISIGDVVNARLQEVENENRALNDMIAGTTY